MSCTRLRRERAARQVPPGTFSPPQFIAATHNEPRIQAPCGAVGSGGWQVNQQVNQNGSLWRARAGIADDRAMSKWRARLARCRMQRLQDLRRIALSNTIAIGAMRIGDAEMP